MIHADERAMTGVGRWTGSYHWARCWRCWRYRRSGVGLDCLAAIRYPFELDYGEGIVWQQAR